MSNKESESKKNKKERISLSFIKQFIRGKKSESTISLPEHEVSNMANLFIKTPKSNKDE